MVNVPGEAQGTIRTGPYAGRRAVLATMHGKEAAVTPMLSARLGLAIEVPVGIKTDRLGTFTGEVARPGTMLETAIAKGRLSMAARTLGSGSQAKGAMSRIPRSRSSPPASS